MVMIVGGGHTMKVWEETPDGRPGWAPICAAAGRSVLIMDWATGPEPLTQKENMDLIKRVVEIELPPDQKVVWLGWSMGGPQAFILATDLLPARTAAILGYAATGPLNTYHPNPADEQRIDLDKPYILPPQKINRLIDSPLFPREARAAYEAEYLIPIPPLMAAIQAKHSTVKKYWPILTAKHPERLPPILMINGARDERRSPERLMPLIDWVKKYQKDAIFKYVEDFPHAGMLCYGNEKIARIYLDWLEERGL